MKPPHPQPPHPVCLHHHHPHLDAILRLRMVGMSPQSNPPAESRCGESKAQQLNIKPLGRRHNRNWSRLHASKIEIQTRPGIHKQNQTEQQPAKSENRRQGSEPGRCRNRKQQASETGRSRKPQIGDGSIGDESDEPCTKQGA